jgi:hypothetical protein
MSERIAAELALLRQRFPGLEYVEDGHWVRLERYPVPAGWSADLVEAAFQIPPEAAIVPYAFCVRPGLTLASGAVPGNYQFPVTTPFGGDWGRFSWSPLAWQPQSEPAAGDNMTHFVRSFADRLAEVS